MLRDFRTEDRKEEKKLQALICFVTEMFPIYGNYAGENIYIYLPEKATGFEESEEILLQLTGPREPLHEHAKLLM